MAQLPYTTPTALKNYLKIPSTDTSNDGFLSLIIPQVSAFVDRYTGRTFGWGDVGDSSLVDYSNADSLGISAATMSGNFLTFKFYAEAPFKVGSVVIVSGFTPSNLNGTWTVTAVSTDSTQVTVNIGQASTNATVIGTVTPNTTNFKFIQQEDYDGTPGATFYLMNMDIKDIVSVWTGSRNILSPTLLSPNQYVWRNDGRIILGGAYFNSYNSSAYSSGDNANVFSGMASGYQTITVSYYCGYIGVPPEISLAVEDIISALFKLRTSQGIKMEMAGDYRVQYNETLRAALKLCPDTLGILDMWRRINM